MNTEKGISVVINTYNASEHLAEVIEAVKDFDEILVCDMESTDDTLDIARRHGCRIVTFPRETFSIVEPAREFAIRQAACPWVLVVDADEIVTPELRDYLYGRIAQPDCPQGLYIPRKNQFLGQYENSFTADYQLRFFVREGTEWPPYVHTFPKVKGRTEKIPTSLKNVCFYHLADESITERIDKDNRYTDGEVEKRGSRHYGICSLLLRPHWKFFDSYIVRGGFRDGKNGLIRAGLTAFYQFVLIAKVMEHRMKNK